MSCDSDSVLELSREVEKLKKNATAETAGGGVAWEEELQVVRSERDIAVSQAKSLRQTVAGLEHKEQVR